MPRKILVVDDEQEILEMTESMLSKRGYEIATALNGVAALDQIKQQRPDLILADVLMPEMDGYAFYKELKNNQMTADIPVLIVTGRGKMEDSFKVIGVDGFITKPFSPEDLISEIEHILNIADNKQEIESSGDKNVSKKILAVGIQNIVVDNMAHQATRAGYKFEQANSGADAIARTVKYFPDIIFVDVQMKDMSAGELIDILRRLPQFDDKPIVAYSYYDSNDLGDPNVRRQALNIEESSQRALKCGATKYMGRYNHQLFMKTVLEFFRHES